MTRPDSKRVRELYQQGKTYEEIKDILGVYVREPIKVKFHPETIRKIPYIGLRRWMFENKMSIAELNRRTGMADCRATIMGNHVPRPTTVEAILQVTGLTYDECFYLYEEGDGE